MQQALVLHPVLHLQQRVDLEQEAEWGGKLDLELLHMWRLMEGQLLPKWWLALLEPHSEEA